MQRERVGSKRRCVWECVLVRERNREGSKRRCVWECVLMWERTLTCIIETAALWKKICCRVKKIDFFHFFLYFSEIIYKIWKLTRRQLMKKNLHFFFKIFSEFWDFEPLVQLYALFLEVYHKNIFWKVSLKSKL